MKRIELKMKHTKMKRIELKMKHTKKYVYFMYNCFVIHKIKNVIMKFEGTQIYTYKNVYFDKNRVYVTKKRRFDGKERHVSYPISKDVLWITNELIRTKK